jgi:hypothetical protein
MSWFTNKKKKLAMIQAIRPTSKATLKLQCLFACRGDINEAEKLYDYFAKDMPELPDYDPVQPTWIDNTKETVNGLMGWLKENQDTLAQGYEFVANVIKRRGAPPAIEAEPTPLPPIND